MIQRNTILTALIGTLLVFAGCGGGGGGGEFAGAALVSVDANPRNLDTGDRTTITIDIEEVNDDGIMLKIRTPLGLSYVTDTGFLIVDNIQVNIDPAAVKSDATHNYLVYFFSRAVFGDENRGSVKITYEGTAAAETGAVEVDPDIDNPTVSNASEFDVTTPKFSAEDSEAITIAN